MSTARVDGAPPPPTTTTDADAVDRIRFESAVSVLDARVDDDDDDDWNEWSLRDDVVILALTCALAGSYIVAFSSVVGFGVETFRALRGDQHERALLMVSAGAGVCLYAADASTWRGARARMVRDVAVGVGCALACAALGLSAYRYPQAPPTLYLVLTPVMYAYARKTMFARRSISSYLHAVARSLYACAAIIVMVFFAECSRTGAWWSPSLEIKYREAIGCASDIGEECLAAYVMWFSPCLAALASMIFGTFCLLLSSSMRTKDKSNVLNFTMRAFGCGVVFVFLGLWVAVSIAGGAKPLSSILVTFSMASLLVLSGALVATIGFDVILSKLTTVPLFASIMSAATEKYANVFKAVAISTPLTFAFGLYLVMSVVNQRVRLLLGTAPDQVSPSKFFTAKVSKQLDELRGWNWSRIMIILHYWVAVVIAFQIVAGSFTVVFLSYLRIKLVTVPIGLVYLAFAVVGLAMFLIPIIPGVPVYLTGGIILTDASLAESLGGGTSGYVWACVWAVTICFAIKLLAVVMQQKGIGERLGNKVWVRSMVNVNSATMRSIRYLLTRPGLNVPKVAILVGGPDWPTSVTTGILRLDVREMLIGTLPVFFLIAPTTLAGAFMLKASRAASMNDGTSNVLCRETSAASIVADDSSPWTSISDISILCTGLVQGLGLIAAAYYIEKTTAHADDELDAMPYDEEVLEIERAEAHRNELMRAIMHWDELSPNARRTLVMSTFTVLAAFWGVMFGPSFLGEEAIVRDYLLTDCISTRLNGKAWNIMTPVGWILLTLICLCLTAISQVRANTKSDVDAIIADEEDFLKALDGIPQRAWNKCPNHNEPINEEKFRERFAESLGTMSRTQIEKIRHTMTERRLATFSEETRTFITESVDRALKGNYT